MGVGIKPTTSLPKKKKYPINTASGYRLYVENTIGNRRVEKDRRK